MTSVCLPRSCSQKGSTSLWWPQHRVRRRLMAAPTGARYPNLCAPCAKSYRRELRCRRGADSINVLGHARPEKARHDTQALRSNGEPAECRRSMVECIAVCSSVWSRDLGDALLYPWAAHSQSGLLAPEHRGSNGGTCYLW